MTTDQIRKLRKHYGGAPALAAALTATGYPVSVRTVENWCQGRRTPTRIGMTGLEKLAAAAKPATRRG